MKNKGTHPHGNTFAEPITGFVKDQNELCEILFIRLYLYVKPEALIPLLSSKRIHLSKPWNTNDVTECVLQNKEKQSEQIKEYGYICLSCRCNSAAMWGYYADSSRGACLAFDIPVEKSKQGQYILLDKNYTVQSDSKRIRAVEYKENRVRENNPLTLLHRKALEWSHEEEYRIAIPLEQAKNESSEDYAKVCYYDDDLFTHLSHVILGVHSQHECADIKAALQNLEIKEVNVTRAAFSPQQFSYLIPDTSYTLGKHLVSDNHSYIINKGLKEWHPVQVDKTATRSDSILRHISEMESLSGCNLSKSTLAYTSISQFTKYSSYQIFFIAAECKSADNKTSYECFIIDKNTVKKISGFTTTAKNKIKDILEHFNSPSKIPIPTI